MKEKILIIGAGQAGMQIASSLRDEGYVGDVTIVGEEAYAPYQRPPLSKAYLAGDMDEESLEFRNEHFYVENNIGVDGANELFCFNMSDCNMAHVELFCLLVQNLSVISHGQADDLKTVTVRSNDIQRLGSDGTRRAKNENATHNSHLSTVQL